MRLPDKDRRARRVPDTPAAALPRYPRDFGRFHLELMLPPQSLTGSHARMRDGTRIHYGMAGIDDGPRGALIHSLAMDRNFWNPVIAQLKDHARLLTYDCRGDGASDSSGLAKWIEVTRDIRTRRLEGETRVVLKGIHKVKKRLASGAVASEELKLALVLALWTGQRQGDLLRLPWSLYDGTHIRLRQSKTGRRS